METLTTIPLFESNQILSSTHLNQLREYLEDEIRYSRIMLSGMGIVTGLNLKSFDGTSIVVTPGYGITTDGFLLDVPFSLAKANEEIVYTRFQPYYDPMLPVYNFGNSSTDSNWDESGSAAKNTQAKPLQKNPLPDPTMFELFTADITKYDKNALDISQFNTKTKFKLDDMAVVLFGEFEDVDLKNCTGTNCDNKGKKRVVAMRMLLVPYAKLNAYDPSTVLKRKDIFDLLNIPRLELAGLSTIDSPAKLTSAYTGIINSHATILHDTIDNAVKKYGYLLALTDNADIAAAITKLLPANLIKDQKYIQYTLDLLDNVTQTFNEFADEAYLFMRSLKITFKPFPRHLTIGRLKPDTARHYDLYRNLFFNVPPVDMQDHRLESVKMLFEKLIALILSFTESSAATNSVADIKITPDGTAQQLFSERSIPYYYDSNKLSGLVKYWNPERTLRGREKERYGYFASSYSAPQLFTSPFEHSLNQLPMLRVEGIAGLNAADAKKKLEELRQKHNLNFSVELLRLEDAADDLNTDYDCEYDDLQADYLQVREEIICCVKEIQEILDLEGSPFETDRLLGYLKALPGFDLVTLEQKFTQAAQSLGIPKKQFGFYALMNIGKAHGPANLLDLAAIVSKMHTVSSDIADKIFSTLPEKFKSFTYSDFVLRFKSLIHLSVQYRTYLEVVLDALEYFYSDIEIKASEEKQLGIYRDIITRLRLQDCSCIYSKLDILEELRALRLQRKKDAGVFKTFISNVKTGLEHYAAVPRDGTIYLIYTNQQVYSSANKNQVIADFSVGGACCGISCGPDSEKTIDQPIIANTNEATISKADLIAKGQAGFVIDVLKNDYRLNAPQKSLSIAEITEMTLPVPYNNIGKISIDKSGNTPKVIYQSNNAVPAIDFFLLKITSTVSHTNPYTGAVTNTTYTDYSALRVIVQDNAIRLINTKPDHAATIIGKKVKIDLLVNDNSDITRKRRIVSLADATGGASKANPYLSELGNTVKLVKDKDGNLCIADFDSSNTKHTKRIGDTITDRFYYIVSDAEGDTSLTTIVDVDILPCCGVHLFYLPHWRYCRNSPPELFIIDVPDYDPEELVVEGDGVSRNKKGQWQFDASSLNTSATTIEFRLFAIIDKTKTELDKFSVDLFNPTSADFHVTAEQPSEQYPYGRYIFTGLGLDADLYEWLIGTVEIATGRIFEVPFAGFYSFALTLRTRKFYGSDIFCTSETTQVIDRIITKGGLKVYNPAVGYVDPGEIYKLNNTATVKLAADPKFVAVDAPVAADLKSFASKFDDAITNPVNATKVIDGSFDGEIIKAGELLDKLNATTSSITDTKLAESAGKAYSGTAVNSLVLLSMRGTDTQAGTAIGETLDKVTEHLTALADSNQLTPSDKQMIANAYSLAANKPEVRLAIDKVIAKYQ